MRGSLLLRSVAGALALAGSLGGRLDAQCGAGSEAEPRIAAVELSRTNVFDSTEDRWWQRLGNTLHSVTRPAIIERELLLERCMAYDSARAAETERNLRALGTFRGVEVDTVHTDSGLVLKVETRDGWSTRPELTFSSTGEQTTFTVGISEENFLGRAAVFGVRYSSDPDRRSVSARFVQRRTFGDFGVQLAGENRTDGWNASAVLNRPFFSSATRRSARALVSGFDGSVRRYRLGYAEPAEILERRFATVQLHAARALRADPEGYLRIGGALLVTSDAYAPKGIDAPRTRTGTLYAWGELSRSRFAEVEQFRSVGRQEDVDLSPRLRAGLLLAPQALGYERGGIGLELGGRAGVPIRSGFVLFEAAANGLYTDAGLDSGRVAVGSTLLLRSGRDVALILHGERGWQERPAPGEEFDLGFGRGLRAHRAHAFTGDNTELVAAELRWIAVRNVLGILHVGFAAAGAHGGAWWNGDPRRHGSEIGGGLRLSPSRLAGGTIGRVDLMWRFASDIEPGGWTVVFGEGLAF